MLTGGGSADRKPKSPSGRFIGLRARRDERRGQVIAKLKAIDYQGPICFSAEYTDEERVDELIVKDLAFARGLLT